MKHLKTKKTLTLLILATYLLFTGCETTTQNTMKIKEIAQEVKKSLKSSILKRKNFTLNFNLKTV